MTMFRNFFTLFFLCIPLFVIGCSSDDDEDEGKKTLTAPIKIDFQALSQDYDEEEDYSPLEANGFNCWSIQNKDRKPGDFYVLLNPEEDEDNLQGVDIILYDKDFKDEDGYNWTGLVDLLFCSLMVDLSPLKDVGIKRITIYGVDKDSKMYANVYDGTTLVAKTTGGPGKIDTEVKMVLEVGQKPVTQLYITGEESAVKRIIIE